MKKLTTLPNSRVQSPRTAPAIRWGVIAPGGIAHAFASAVNTETQSRIAAVGSRSLERATTFARKFEKGAEVRAYGSYEELVSDDSIDAVYVASPHSEHFAHACLAINAGKPVLVEKAFTKTAKEAQSLTGLARQKNLLLVEAMWMRFLPHIDVVRQLVQNEDLGEIEVIIADHGQRMNFPPEHRLQNLALAGGALLDMGIYPLSFMHMILGSPKSLQASATLSATGVDETLSAILRWDNAHGMLNTSQKSKTPTTATVSGTNARIEIPHNFYQPNEINFYYPDGTHLHSRPLAVAGLAYQAAEFARLLDTDSNESSLISHSTSVELMAIMDKIRLQVGVLWPGE